LRVGATWHSNLYVQATIGPAAGPIIGRDGACTVHARRTLVAASAGTLTVTGASSGPIRVGSPTEADPRNFPPDEVAPLFSASDSLALTTSGGADLPTFNATVIAPAPILGDTSHGEISRDGYAVTWDAGAGPEIDVVLGVADAAQHAGVMVVCRVPDNGTFTIPASTLALVPPADKYANVLISRVASVEQVVGNTRVTFEAIQGVMRVGRAVIK
jgi:hypothetical protein